MKYLNIIYYVLSLSLAVKCYDMDDLVIKLPDCDPFETMVFSGYLTVSETKKLHYLLVES